MEKSNIKSSNCISLPVAMSEEGLSFEDRVACLRNGYLYHLRYTLGATELKVTDQERFLAFSYAVRDQVVDRWVHQNEKYHLSNARHVYYLSLEFLIGRLLSNNVVNLGIESICKAALSDKEMNWDRMRNFEVDAGFGNGGLGRLAACFLDSMATMDLPCFGYGLRYDYGIFKQKIVKGMQVEEPDNWRRDGYPWEMMHPEEGVHVTFGGKVVVNSEQGRRVWRWQPDERVRGIPYDIPVIGYGGKTVNTLRLWSAKADNEFDFQDFNEGAYLDAVEQKVTAENLTKVLYPNDNTTQGKELRLRQQYFFVACTLRDILRRFNFRNNVMEDLPSKIFIQLNDTHPTLVIPELMRILVDEEGIGWDDAWAMTTACVGYTNHTILPEALEKWGLGIFQKNLPRHVQIIFEINGRFLREVSARYPGDIDRLRRMSIIEEGGEQRFRMANLAIVGSVKVNGVAQIHSNILKATIFRDFAEFWPGKFTNMTNGITQRRWLLCSNPQLASLITEKLGDDDWITNLTELRRLEQFIDDDEFLTRLGEVKRNNKRRLGEVISRKIGLTVNPDSIFDIQVKRLHEYKRQLLLTLYIILLYNRLVDDPNYDMHPRTFIFAGKAAPGYKMAKLIIRLIHHVAEVVNNNPVTNGKLKVVFLPDYRVSLAEVIIPAADISEQISLAGTEASGTGNMKLMLNGALTMGTMDGANVEIYEEVGAENIFIFGMSADEVVARRQSYSPWQIYHSDAEIRRVLDNIRANVFSLLSPGLFDPIVRVLLDQGDYYMLLEDLRSYVDAQLKADELYRNQREWLKCSLLNIARSGKFSSDRTISNYASEIWDIEPFRG